jgi:D-alanyl-D-alanine carboxypeptidase/D-alanyl-D-alanine-endopeptidase (penicillin-binding protein 4)
MEESPIFSHAHSGLVVYDPDEDHFIYSYKGEDLFTPASNTKLWAVYAGLNILGDSIPSIKYCENGGKRYIQGMADPTFLHPLFKKQIVADRLKANHDTLRLYTGLLDVPRYGPGWMWDDYLYDYQAERSPLPLYGNVVHISNITRHGSLDIYPQYFEPAFDLQCDSTLTDYTLWRNEWKNDFQLKFACDNHVIDEVVPYITSDSLAAGLLQEALNLPVVLEGMEMDDCPWQILYSQPVDSLYKLILLESDNFMAEQLLLMCALALSNTLDPAIVINHVMTNDFPHLLDAIHWEDGSGLSRYNQFTPQSMVELLTKLYRSPGVERWIGLLPAGGRSGTLRNAFSAPKPYIFAKTGSMRYVYNLSGFLLTDSGKFLIFSFMNNHFDVSFDVLKKAMETILTEFKEKY